MNTKALNTRRRRSHLLVKSFSGFSVSPDIPNALLKYQAKISIKKGSHKTNSNLYLAANNARLVEDKIA